MSGFQTDVLGSYIVSSQADVRDYSIDWSANLQTGETISISAWTVPSPLTASQPSLDGAVATTRIAAGSAPDQATYYVHNQITTSLGRILDRSFRLVMDSRA